MRFLTIFAAAVLMLAAPTGANSQNLLVQPLDQGESVTPVTAVKVVLAVEKERVVPGPYARYAQKYLGAVPPLSERTGYIITGAWLSAAEYTGGAATVPDIAEGIHIRPNVYDPYDFVKSAIDRSSPAEMTAENMARDAANTIFTLRKRRFDLISGEAGENVYGAGMGAAIEELARMEEEYVSLFMGKTSVEVSTVVFEVVPEAGKTTYTVCRFSSGEGVLPENDLSAEPIVLSLTPEAAALPVQRADKKTGTLYRVAAWANAVLMDGPDVIASKRLPVFQFGETVTGR